MLSKKNGPHVFDYEGNAIRLLKKNFEGTTRTVSAGEAGRKTAFPLSPPAPPSRAYNTSSMYLPGPGPWPGFFCYLTGPSVPPVGALPLSIRRGSRYRVCPRESVS